MQKSEAVKNPCG